MDFDTESAYFNNLVAFVTILLTLLPSIGFKYVVCVFNQGQMPPKSLNVNWSVYIGVLILSKSEGFFLGTPIVLFSLDANR